MSFQHICRWRKWTNNSCTMSRKTRKNAFLGALQASICYAILFTVISVAEVREACDLKGRLFRVFLFFLSRTTPIYRSYRLFPTIYHQSPMKTAQPNSSSTRNYVTWITIPAFRARNWKPSTPIFCIYTRPLRKTPAFGLPYRSSWFRLVRLSYGTFICFSPIPPMPFTHQKIWTSQRL